MPVRVTPSPRDSAVVASPLAPVGLASSVIARVTTDSPLAIPGSRSLRIASLPSRRTASEASSPAVYGELASARPVSSNTTAGSSRPVPEPPCSSGRCSPGRPSWSLICRHSATS